MQTQRGGIGHASPDAVGQRPKDCSVAGQRQPTTVLYTVDILEIGG
jgi:hypothetical protein